MVAVLEFMSDIKDGVLVCKMASSKSLIKSTISLKVRPRAGASISLLPSNNAAGCASHVGYQNERISRLA